MPSYLLGCEVRIIMNLNKKIRITTFSLYLIALFVITEFSHTFNLSLNFNLNNASYNIIPLHFLINGIRKALTISNQYSNVINLWSVLKDIFLGFICNIILFLPLGFLMPIINRKVYNAKRIVLIGFLISFIIELLQLMTSIAGLTYDRVFDVDDIIANVIGSVIGFLIYKSLRKKTNKMEID